MNFSEKMQGAGVFVDNTRTTNNYLYLNNKIFRAQKCDRWHDSCLLEKVCRLEPHLEMRLH